MTDTVYPFPCLSVCTLLVTFSLSRSPWLWSWRFVPQLIGSVLERVPQAQWLSCPGIHLPHHWVGWLVDPPYEHQVQLGLSHPCSHFLLQKALASELHPLLQPNCPQDVLVLENMLGEKGEEESTDTRINKPHLPRYSGWKTIF